MPVVMSTSFIKDEILRVLHPRFRQWFEGKFDDFTEPQKYSIIPIHQRENILVSSPTGTGKTLCAFGAILNELVDLDEKGLLEDRTYAVYVNPLKSLSRDIEVNLNTPLREISLQKEKPLSIRVGTRTGDTTAHERAKMKLHVPHILITTPESLAILIQTPSFREHVKQVEWFICDEIHALAENKRGTHLALTLEMLQRLSPGMCRVGLSATVSPLDQVAQFLVGSDRTVKIVDVAQIKQLDLKVLSPVPNLIDTSFEELQRETYLLLDKLIQEHKTTLIFTNTRAATERVVHHLRSKFPDRYTDINDEPIARSSSIEPFGEGEELVQPSQVTRDITGVGAHHGSLSREHRYAIEQGLRDGKLKAVVCSTSLELGIDIGYIDLVILLGSPKSVARALQRVGRAGHSLHQITKGRIIVQDRDDLVECAVLLKNALEKKIDAIHIPANALDVLAQQIYGMLIIEKMTYTELYTLVKQAYPYRHLENKDFSAIIDYLSGEHTSLEERHIYAKIWFDKDTGMMGRKGKLARVLYMTNIGTIPDQTGVLVKVGEQKIGTIDEAFLERLKPNDIFVLGGTTYQFRHTKGMVAQVLPINGRRPTVPSWYSEMLPLSFDLARSIGDLRKLLDEKLGVDNGDAKKEEKTVAWLQEYLYLDENAAQAIYQYHKEQKNYIGLPTSKRIIVELYSEESKQYAIFHSLYGRRVNDVLSRAIGYALGRLQKVDVEIGINDNAFYLASKNIPQTARALSAIDVERLPELMERALEKTNVLSRRFRQCAARALMILRAYKGVQKRVGRQQVSSQILLSAVRRIGDDFPILKEARREVLEDVMDIEHAIVVIQEIKKGKIEIVEKNTKIPSPFAFNIIMQGYADILRMEDRVEFLKRMHSQVLAKIALDFGRKGMSIDIPLLKNPVKSYEELWGEQDQLFVEEEENFKEALRLDLTKAARKTGMPVNHIYEFNRMIHGETEGFKQDFITFLEQLVSGSVPPVWTDRLVKFIKENLLKIK